MQTPEPEISSSKTDPSVGELEDHLDELWESYLTLLDQYTKAQDEIKKHFNSGFLSLAKAQSSASLGRRYGQDWYDERMKASRKARVLSASVDDTEDSVGADLQRLSISAVPRGPTIQIVHSEEKKSKSESEIKEEESKQQQQQQPLPPGTPEPESKPKEDEETKSDQSEESKPTNPLRWYGVLVPPELRRAQSAFTAATGGSSAPEESDENCNGPIADAVNAARGMRDIEAEIRKIRKAVKKAEKASGASAH